MSAVVHRWGTIPTHFSTFAAWVDDAGRLVRFNLHAQGAVRVDRDAVRDEQAIEHVRRQVLEYCAGERREFDLQRAAQGSQFEQEVWEALMEIPYGETTSYGALARRLGYPDGARAAGRANATNPIALIVPCHRVIGADGSLTGYGGGLPLKQALLLHEAEHAGRPHDLFGSSAPATPSGSR